ncbi:DUF1972 domain-containing protein [Luminiphilus sp.]|nr:DUF1972 domain-containing protein [Luminiphilus sp.]
MSAEIAIIGTAGLPAKYGGFETLAQNLVLIDDQGFIVYCSGKPEPAYSPAENVRLYHINIPANGALSIVYDIACVVHAVFSGCRRLLLLGSSASFAIGPLKMIFPSLKVITNIDGLESTRAKWGVAAGLVLSAAERNATMVSDKLISDNPAIKSHLFSKYGAESALIAYGGDHALRSVRDVQSLKAFAICRIEPENNIELILSAFVSSDMEIIFVGNWQASEYGRALYSRWCDYKNLDLRMPIYSQYDLDEIRSNTSIYVHGHSAGGTNPSLVEAMCCGFSVVSFDCIFNRETTHDSAYYFKSSAELASIMSDLRASEHKSNADEMFKLGQEHYTWEIIRKKYKDLFISTFG